MRGLFNDEVMHSLQLRLVRWIVADKFLGQPDSPQRKGDDLFDMSFFGKREFTTASSQVNQQELGRTRAQVCDHAQVNQPPFLQSGDDLKVPAGDRFYPLGKQTRIVAITHSAGGNNEGLLYRVTLDRTLEPAQEFQSVRHGLRIKRTVAE